MSLTLLQSLQEYHLTATNNTSFNATQQSRKQLQSIFNKALYQENRRYFSKEWHTYDGNILEQPGEPQQISMLHVLQDICTELLETSHDNVYFNDTHESKKENKECDLLFIFIFEVVYSVLVLQLRTLVMHIVDTNTTATNTTNTGSGSDSVKHKPTGSCCRDNYKAYLTARQLVGNVSGSGLGRFSWASTIYPEEAVDETEGPQCSNGSGTTVLQSQQYSSNDKTNPLPLNSATNGVQTGIGAYLMSQLTWPISPVGAAEVMGDRTGVSVPLPVGAAEVMGDRTGVSVPLPVGASEAVGGRTEVSVLRPVGASEAVGIAATGASVEEYQPSSVPATPARAQYSISHIQDDGLTLHTYDHHPTLTTAADTYTRESHASPTVLQHSPHIVTPTTTVVTGRKDRSSTWSIRSSSPYSTGRPLSASKYDGRFSHRKSPSSRRSTYSLGTCSGSRDRSTASAAGVASVDSPGLFAHYIDNTPHSTAIQKNKQPPSCSSSKYAGDSSSKVSDSCSALGTPCRSSWRYRERLIIRYVTSVKVATCILFSTT